MLNTDKQDKYKMYHISLLSLVVLSVEHGAIGAIYNARFPVKINISEIFSLSMSMKGVLQNKNHSMTTELLQRSRPYFGSQMGAKKIHFLLYRSSDSWQLHLRVDKAAQILQRANITKFQQFSSCSKSIAKLSVAFRNTSTSK